MPANSSAGVTGRRAGVRTGDSGTNRSAAAAATAVAIIGSQNNHAYRSESTMGPATTIPTPKPTAVKDMRTLRAPFIFSRNSSRMIPKESGSTPPPAPCRTRAAISQPTLGARAAARDPRESAHSVTTSIRRLPTTSPIRPSSGVQIDADRRYAVSTHVTVFWSVSSSTWMCASTGTVSDWSSTKDDTEIASTANVISRRPRRRLRSDGCMRQPASQMWLRQQRAGRRSRRARPPAAPPLPRWARGWS